MTGLTPILCSFCGEDCAHRSDEIETLRVERAAMVVEWERMKDPHDRSAAPFQRLNRMLSAPASSGSPAGEGER